MSRFSVVCVCEGDQSPFELQKRLGSGPHSLRVLGRIALVELLQQTRLDLGRSDGDVLERLYDGTALSKSGEREPRHQLHSVCWGCEGLPPAAAASARAWPRRTARPSPTNGRAAGWSPDSTPVSTRQKEQQLGMHTTSAAFSRRKWAMTRAPCCIRRFCSSTSSRRSPMRTDTARLEGGCGCVGVYVVPAVCATADMRVSRLLNLSTTLSSTFCCLMRCLWCSFSLSASWAAVA